MLFREVPSRLHVLTQVVALAATQVARDCGVEAVLKWPNDILVGTQKLAGILAQAAPVGPDGKIPFVVVGIGCNLGWAPPEAASLATSGWTREVSPDEFLRAMLPEIDRLLAMNDEAMNAEYVANLATVGSRVRVEMPNGEDVIGRAMSVELDGRLVVLDDCAVTHRIDTADVVHLRPVSD
jgi:BirA family biotin operon repressor/biotin-[acetyl-CoA-carboxylase] ligase